MSDKSNLPKMHKLIKNLLQNSVTLSSWLLYNFSEKNTVRDYLLECPVMDMKYMVGGILKVAINTVCKDKQSEPMDETQLQALSNSVKEIDLLDLMDNNNTDQKKNEFEDFTEDDIIKKFVITIL